MLHYCSVVAAECVPHSRRAARESFATDHALTSCRLPRSIVALRQPVLPHASLCVASIALHKPLMPRVSLCAASHKPACCRGTKTHPTVSPPSSAVVLSSGRPMESASEARDPAKEASGHGGRGSGLWRVCASTDQHFGSTFINRTSFSSGCRPLKSEAACKARERCPKRRRT